MANIRNFSIIAHIDHGKSTLADRLLEITGTVAKDKLQPQLLDSLALERERGITIKLAPVRLNYTFNSQLYTLNLIDTPGHMDFSYEVSRALAAVEGAILLVDATQGIQAQTLDHGLSALNQNLTLIPVINKVDMLSIFPSPNGERKIDFSHPEIEKCALQLMDTFGFREDEIILASGKTGEGVEEILKAIIEKVPAPKADPSPDKSGSGRVALRALVFDSFFDSYKGVMAQVRIVEGRTPRSGEKIVFLGTGASGQILEVGYFVPQLTVADCLEAGEIGYIATGIKQPDLVRVGDTISTDLNVELLPGYREVKPMVYVGLYPIETGEYFELKEALAKFRLTDPAFSYELEQSAVLGSGFRCGFLGLLHAEVVQERLSEEFNVNLLATTPSVEYQFAGQTINNPADLPQGENIKDLKEPWVKLQIFAPQSYIGPVMDLVQERRGKFINMQHYGIQVELSYEMPLSEMITDFYDKLKSVSSGFASLDWEFLEFREVDAVRVDFLVGGEKVDALSTIVYRPKAESVGRRMVEKLKEILPRQNFTIAIQAAIGGKIIARETISPFRKDVTAKLYGGDRTRKDKLLEKQKKGKKKMKMIGKVEIPQEAFLSILKS
ncbi:MAG: Elongation factor 4 [Candidatus Daviesbacteria bacterium GW2011_GWA1_41_61]|uniref:Elongation factor 4 n=1 Tax=Candidatus Daviesbacteria bacterium GW2011_GWA2_40_9 TaxID=1618424 RepID=A0A0G0X743_9BACT|nr:MAG: Elongation factor 4 [Candidatus Daviesbacteria bacterium GW2011_GWC1_40_9]KKR83457.1 MAG: Elongation factor 4 [Candidatus Daviesbacteria bacterium GW2011_GWA2_40_9]KKR93839.1 MAG: Elongation factor 4 [Candidatus Daviesbacteria bacterium GW2011_GWB1_41_15]KKS15305.1 MAG: Elongation factor 4 [Candidatus Daviesbacteria bacterium GW2011_GWA1_41_61]